VQEAGETTRHGFRLEIRERVATLTFDRPPVNVLDIRTLAGMTRALEEVAERRDVAVLVVGGAGSGFSAGVDVGEHLPEKVEEMIRTFHGFCRTLLDFPVPTLARIHGNALGGGCEVALCCDLAVAGASARVGQPEIRLGVFPPVAAVLLPRRAGWHAAAGAILWGGTFSAEAAVRVGLVSEVVPDDRLAGRVEELATRAAGISTAALRLARTALRRGAEGPAEEAIAAVERIYLDELMHTHDATEGIRSFLEKRAPRWRDR
jgi:cyclohexa-1,5-dienecarbonyl-CoA hydratase